MQDGSDHIVARKGLFWLRRTVSTCKLCCFLGLVLTVSCGPTKPTSSLSTVETPPPLPSHHLVVVSGGFNSCPTFFHSPYHQGMYDPATSLVLALRRMPEVRNVRLLISCFGQSNRKLKYAVGLRGGATIRGDKEDWYNAILEELFAMPANHAVHFVGHSYGGSLTMEMISRLPDWVNVRSLATLDPISRQNCSPSWFVRAYTRSMFWFNPHSGCTQPPQDYRPYYRSYRERTHHWFNAYQTQYGFLHSGYIGFADHNWEREYDTNIFPAFMAHAGFLSEDEAIWSRVIHYATQRDEAGQPPLRIAQATRKTGKD